MNLPQTIDKILKNRKKKIKGDINSYTRVGEFAILNSSTVEIEKKDFGFGHDEYEPGRGEYMPVAIIKGEAKLNEKKEILAYPLATNSTKLEEYFKCMKQLVTLIKEEKELEIEYLRFWRNKEVIENIWWNKWNDNKKYFDSDKTYDNILKELKKIKFETILDIGCGDGELLESIKAQYPHSVCLGIERNSQLLKFSQNKDFKVILGDIRNIENICSEKKDLIIFGSILNSYVLTYKESEVLLSCALKLLNPGGHIISSSNVAAFFNAKDYRQRGLDVKKMCVQEVLYQSKGGSAQIYVCQKAA